MINVIPMVIKRKITKELHKNRQEGSFKCFTTKKIN